MRIGLDLGGTKIEGIALDDDGALLARRRMATPRHDYAATVEAMAGLVRDLEAETGRRGTVGVGMPGALSPATGLVKNANSTWLIGQPLDRDLSSLLERPVRFANDANCFALSEAVDGAAAGARVVFGVIVGTGTGGGIAVERKVLTGPNAIAGEWGHNPLPWPREGEWPGPPCYCGKTGCVETFLSGTGMARDFQETTGEDVVAPEIVARAARGDAAAGAPSGATRSGCPAPSPWSSTSSTPTWWCSAEACRRSPGSTRACPGSGLGEDGDEHGDEDPPRPHGEVAGRTEEGPCTAPSGIPRSKPCWRAPHPREDPPDRGESPPEAPPPQPLPQAQGLPRGQPDLTRPA